MRSDKKYAYTTLITRASYLAGVVILAYTLRKQNSKYPLIVYYTLNLEPEAVRALELEIANLSLILRPCEALLPPKHVSIRLIAERFNDTWTKLRVFDVDNYDAVCYLDADMALFKNMDTIFSKAGELPKDWIAANHACVCNLDNDPWAPEDWVKENCAYTPISHPDALTNPIQASSGSRGTYHLLNSGMFLYHPSKELWNQILYFFNTSDKLGAYNFPDQDFLVDFFRGRWLSVGWHYNALKTMKYWHPNIWRDDQVICLHYIVDKPWAARIGENGMAGYKGRDGVTHGWWWNEYMEWTRERHASNEEDVIQIVGMHVAKKDGSEDNNPDMKAIGSNVQAFANS
ncbi:glycosyltransferase family 8 protein [Acidomyces richmondensis BFW]|nr:MAG: glycosyltransferase family 8 protein [Acidomyces sp. 'richmondensis']KYG43445.1 glycosyltransferase family 8 protein [Acidomyces richmondensis BFW]